MHWVQKVDGRSVGRAGVEPHLSMPKLMFLLFSANISTRPPDTLKENLRNFKILSQKTDMDQGSGQNASNLMNFQQLTLTLCQSCLVPWDRVTKPYYYAGLLGYLARIHVKSHEMWEDSFNA